MVFVLWAALFARNGLLTLIGIAVQCVAAFWYTISYIPGARTVVAALVPNPFS
jgi:hypothetical protein